jgi:hypothetical protein
MDDLSAPPLVGNREIFPDARVAVKQNANSSGFPTRMPAPWHALPAWKT